jgi:hypothetical protein
VEWKQAFENACHRAELPTEMEPVSRFAFTVALDKTRYSAGLFGWHGWFVNFISSQPCCGLARLIVFGVVHVCLTGLELKASVYVNLSSKSLKLKC